MALLRLFSHAISSLMKSLLNYQDITMSENILTLCELTDKLEKIHISIQLA
jgi:hypothetical protein